MYFVHVIDNFTEIGLCKYISDSFPISSADYHQYQNPLENKWGAKESALNKLSVQMGLNILQNNSFLKFIEEKSGIKVENDPYLHGAGLHLYQNGSFLKRHLDYSIHPITGKERRMNAILYVSEWDSIYGGALCFYDAKGNVTERIYPKLNRLVLFETNDYSYHGVELCSCPANLQRKILTVFYVSDARPNIAVRKRAQFFTNDKNLNDIVKIRSERLLENTDFEKDKLLILFAVHNTENYFTEVQLNYVEQLLALPPEKTIYILTTGKNMIKPTKWLDSVIIIEDKNINRDFGLWWRAINNNNLNLKDKLKNGEYKKLLLANDSCEITRPLINVYLNMFNCEFWGICDSMQVSHHLQSYFLFFSGTDSINCFLNFVELNPFGEGKEMIIRQIINKYEVGLSTFMISRKFFINVAYSHKMFDVQQNSENQSHSFHKELQLLGCPLRKLKRRDDNYVPELIRFKFLYSLTELILNKHGLEIGGPSYLGQNVYKNCASIDNVTLNKNDSNHNFINHKLGKVIISEMCNLNQIKDCEYDFIFASNVMQLTANPLKGFMEFKRILKKNGNIILILPDKNKSFYHKKNDTKFSEIQLKYVSNVQEDDLSTLGEILKYHDFQLDNTSLENFVKKSLQNESLRELHHHVFSDLLIKEIAEYIKFDLLLSFNHDVNNWYILKNNN